MTFASKKDYLKHLQNIKNITYYIDYFSDDSQIFGEWNTTLSISAIHYSKEVDDFVEALYDNGFMSDYDWTNSDIAETIFKTPNLIKSLEYMDIETLLTSIVRKERFCAGVLMNAIDNGIILSVLERLRNLYDVEENSLMLVHEFDEAILKEKEAHFKKYNEKAKKLLEDGTTIEPFYELSEELDLLEKINNNELIELNEFYITGIGYYEAKEIDFTEIKFLTLCLEPSNDYDTKAIEVYYQDLKVGYVPKEENSLIYKMMYQGVNVIAQIIEYNPSSSLDKKIKVRLFQNGMNEIITLKDLMQEHREVFGVEPYVIGMYWSDQEAIINGISEALETGVPYNEYLLLSVEDRKAFDSGSLVF